MNIFAFLVGESTWKEDGSCGDSGGEKSVVWEIGDIFGGMLDGDGSLVMVVGRFEK
jgi:hypothetical protein